jgi:phosphatidate phosphatase APP1
MISSHPDWSSYKEAPIKGNWFKRWLKSRFRYVDYPFLLAYRGFGNKGRIYLQGHVFKGMALNKPSKNSSTWKNIIGMIKMFLIRTVENTEVALHFQKCTYTTQTDAQGFFEFDLSFDSLEEGWLKCELQLLDDLVEGQEEIKVESEIHIADDYEFGLISDVDDTFLISHVSNKLKKLHTLATNNFHSRKPVEGVVKFYQALEKGLGNKKNPFFYVSSSEWNLYDFLVNFTRTHNLPKGVFQLKEIKDRLTDFFRSGYGSHNHKQVKIERIMDMYPDRSFILLGDNSQHDPQIYSEIAQKHASQLKAVYIRGVNEAHWAETEKKLDQIRQQSIPAFQFAHSQEAFKHALSLGFIKDESPVEVKMEEG